MQGRRGTNPFKSKSKIEKGASSTLKECDAAQAERHVIKPERHVIKLAWVVENCLRKGGHKVSGGRRVQIKECNRAFKTKTASKKANNQASKIEVAVAKVLKKVTPKSKVLKKVIPKDEALKDKSRSDKSGEGCALAQNLTPGGGKHETAHKN